jgi:hypothetical protein
MRWLFSISFAVCVFGVACGRRSEIPTSTISDATNQDASKVVAEPDVAGVLAQLTQALRRYSAEKREVPASLDALVADGYLQFLPQAPAGRAFAIDQKKVQVILK